MNICEAHADLLIKYDDTHRTILKNYQYIFFGLLSINKLVRKKERKKKLL